MCYISMNPDYSSHRKAKNVLLCALWGSVVKAINYLLLGAWGEKKLYGKVYGGRAFNLRLRRGREARPRIPESERPGAR